MKQKAFLTMRLNFISPQVCLGEKVLEWACEHVSIDVCVYVYVREMDRPIAQSAPKSKLIINQR